LRQLEHLLFCFGITRFECCFVILGDGLVVLNILNSGCNKVQILLQLFSAFVWVVIVLKEFLVDFLHVDSDSELSHQCQCAESSSNCVDCH